MEHPIRPRSTSILARLKWRMSGQSSSRDENMITRRQSLSALAAATLLSMLKAATENSLAQTSAGNSQRQVEIPGGAARKLKEKRRKAMTKTLLVVVAALMSAFLPTTQAPAQKLSDQEAYEIARDAYIYAYPAVLEYVTKMQGTNFAEPTGVPSQSPFNQFGHARAFPPADWKAVVRPNADTLYSVANLDLNEPIVLSVPATDRYFLLPLLSMWTDVFASLGTRTTGRNTARDFLIVGPRWQGTAPQGLEIIRSPTR